MTKIRSLRTQFLSLEIGNWILFEIWNLGFGISNDKVFFDNFFVLPDRFHQALVLHHAFF